MPIKAKEAASELRHLTEHRHDGRRSEENGMNTEKAAALFRELADYLESLHDDSLVYQKRNAYAAAACLSEAADAEEKEEIIRTFCRLLYPYRGGLSDVILLDTDYETRVSLNAPLERIRD